MGDIPYLASILETIVSPAISLLLVVAILYFFWGIVKFIQNAESDTGRKEGQRHMLWGIVGIAIMISAIGIVRLVANSIPGADDGKLKIPAPIDILGGGN